MDAVDETLREWRRTAFIWGKTDCLLSLARYFALTGLPDAAPTYVGTYSSEDEASRVLAGLGGFGCAMMLMGAVPVDGNPRRGDAVGLCYGENELIAGLCTGDSVAARLERGVIEAPLRLIQWRGVWRGRS